MNAVAECTEVIDFGGLEINWDPRALRPRPWTVAQSRWAAELSDACPDGPLLELCCGAGQIGLLAARLSGRSLVQVDHDSVAAACARRNAAATDIATEVREAPVFGALGPDEHFPLVIFDPPWVPTGQVGRHPDDPVGAIDGGLDGTEQLVLGMGVALRHLDPAGQLVVQVGTPDQVEVVRTLMAGLGRARSPRRDVVAVRDHRPGGLLVQVGPVEPVTGPGEDDAQVSEVAAFGDPDDAILPSDAVAGYPLADDEGGAGIQEGAAGPEAPPRNDPRGRR